MPAVEMVDAELFVVEHVRGLVGSVTALSGLTVGTKVEPGKTPKMFVQVRKIGGDEVQRVAERPRVDLRVWGDNQPGGDHHRMQLTRTLLAHIRRDLGCRVMAVPVNLPDPADPTIQHTLMTIEPILRGVQL